jgi:hypothetical protein
MPFALLSEKCGPLVTISEVERMRKSLCSCFALKPVSKEISSTEGALRMPSPLVSLHP